MTRIADAARRHGLDVLVVLLAVGAMLEVVLRRHAPNAPRSPVWFSVMAIGVVVLPVFARRRAPFAALTAYWVLAVVLSFVDGRLIPFLNSVLVLGAASAFLFGNLPDARQARAGLIVVLGGGALIVQNGPDHTLGQLVFVPLLFGICWLAGFALRERAEQAEAAERRAALAEREREVAQREREVAEREREAAEREREAVTRIAVAEERARIARELHDIVAHAVSVMVLHAGAVRHKLPVTLQEDREALHGVEQAGRTALAEMRRLLGAMRQDKDGVDLEPQPGLGDLPRLVKDVDRAGLPVRLHVDGEPLPLPRAIDLSAYRIVQEGLTNSLKHAGARHADVTLRYRRDTLQIDVVDDGTGVAASDGLGHGLVGIRERVKIYGGDMTAGSAPTGGFVLSARLPLSADHHLS
ncbi:MAG: sensor histidine kinase [Solirubrobacteraceae bacterium]